MNRIYRFFNSVKIAMDKVAAGLFVTLSILIILLVVIMGAGLVLKSLPILQEVSFWDLVTESTWQPFKNKFGFFPFLISTLAVTIIALIIALPVSLLSALFLTEFARQKIKKMVFPVLDILAGLPSVIYGVWGTLVIVPMVASITPEGNGFSAGYSTLAAGIVGGIMIMPMTISLFVELFGAVPQDLRDASYSIGATRWQTSIRVVVKKTLPGIIAAVVLAISRAFGETIAILMVCGNMAKVPESVFDPCYPLPALLANNYGEMLSLPMYESALMFSALLLFAVVVIFNIVSRVVLHRISKNE